MISPTVLPCAVAWDIDGTLVDSEPLHHRALLSTGDKFGADLSDLPDQAFRGVHVDDVWELLRSRFPSTLPKAAWIAAINRFYVAHRAELVPIPGALGTLRRLHDRGVPQVCVSNSSRSVVDANLDALGVQGIIAFSISLDDVTAGKPDPEPYALAVRRLGLPPSQVLAVEDSATGLRSAMAAGLVTVGFQSSPEVPALDAHILVNDLTAVPALVQAEASTDAPTDISTSR